MKNEKALYAVIDLKSFYASCECVARGLDPFTTPLIVSDPERNESSIVMSSSPFLKEKYHIPNVCRRRDVPKSIPGLIIAQPRMAHYIETSAKVVSILLDFVSEEDLHVYSIDESFINIGPYLSLSGKSPEQFVSDIQKTIKRQTGLTATAGIGPNMFLAKICLDNEGKKKPPFLARWEYGDVPTKLWKISPITKIWGISSGTEAHLKRIGIRSIEALAKTDVDLLTNEFGIMGKQLHDLANGRDGSDIREKYVPKEKSLSIGQTLMRDYSAKEAELIIREMCDDLCLRLREEGKKARLVGLYVGYDAETGGGFSRQASLDKGSDDNDVLYHALMELFHRHIEDFPVRRLGLSFGRMIGSNIDQLDVFEDFEESQKRGQCQRAIDKIQLSYGKNSCLRASSLTEASTIKERHGQIGGHKA